ncbi:MAG: sensor domain-containing diguanylate cyclase, partial [Phycisphaerae bacterium]|nr:sensor domain-containing diguanylate cyclase [Phycisphaerae bacterium]
IVRLSQQISSLHLDQVVQLCVQRIPPLLGVKLVSLYFHDEPKHVLRLQRHNHPYPINAVVSLEDRPNSPMALAVARKQVMLINEPAWSELIDHSTVTRPYAHRYSSGNCVIAPLLAGGRVVGVFNLADKEDGLPFDELTDLLPVRQLAELLGASICNIELYQSLQQQAKTDGMTGLVNHGTFVRELTREINRSGRYGSPLSLILADVDSLKRINDQLGHVTGDRALQMVARQILHSIRDSDLAARYGGDEFAILLPSTPIGSAKPVAERIVQTIAAIPLTHGDKSMYVTVSVGVGEFDGKSTAESFIEQVDHAMYQAKAEGKNRIALHT